MENNPPTAVPVHLRKRDGVHEAHLVTLAWTPAPNGRAHRSLRLTEVRAIGRLGVRVRGALRAPRSAPTARQLRSRFITPYPYLVVAAIPIPLAHGAQASARRLPVRKLTASFLMAPVCRLAYSNARAVRERRRHFGFTVV